MKEADSGRKIDQIEKALAGDSIYAILKHIPVVSFFLNAQTAKSLMRMTEPYTFMALIL